MKSLVILQYRFTTVLLLFCASFISAQSSYKESFNVGDDVLVSVNTSHTNVVFETWNKNIVEVEAFVDDESLSAKEKKEIFDNWNFEVLGNSKKVVITSNEGSLWTGIESMGSLKALHRLDMEALKGLEGLDALKGLGDMHWNFEIPDIPDFADFPKWPFTDARASIKSEDGHFDYNFDYNFNFEFGHKDHNSFDRSKYDKDKKAYVKKLNKKYGTDVSVRKTDAWLKDVDEWTEEFEQVMEDWGEDFGNKFEHQFGPEFEKKMEKWGEEFGKDMEKFGEEMEKWSEEFGKSMEKWGEEFGKDMEKWVEEFEENGNRSFHFQSGKHGLYKENAVKAKKTIIIRLPKGSKTDINVRYGEVKMADAWNVRATLNYAKLTANSIDGGETLINAAYAPVYVNNWGNGKLDLKYVDDCKLNEVVRINLQAISSNVNINSLGKEAFLTGSFGNLYINKIGKDFETIDIVLENTDATLSMPNVAFTFYYNGKKSRFKVPAGLKITSKNTTDSRSLLKGYSKAEGSGRSMTINASYSNVNFND
ncbi:MAG: hypothetical protein E2O83_03340 [Bacteroidetes bacterium]|nr:MAG: hypothetical protein E2O83_03340 [Bacteroidota bacterium]